MRNTGVSYFFDRSNPAPLWVTYVAFGSYFFVLVAVIVLVALYDKPPTRPSPYGPNVTTRQQPRIPKLNKWCSIVFNISHIGRSKNQSPSQWSRLFMPIPLDLSDIIQITPYDARGNITQGGLKSNVIEGYAAFGVLYVGLEYWGEAPWNLYVGWFLDQSGKEDAVCNPFILV